MSDIPITDLPQLGRDYAEAVIALHDSGKLKGPPSKRKQRRLAAKVFPDANREELRIILEYTQWMTWASLLARGHSITPKDVN